jgi:hypothetical protein
MGFSTSTDASILDRRCVPVSLARPAHLPCPVNDSGKRQMTLQQITEHIGTGSSLQWIKMAAFMVHGQLSCVDGRDDCGIIGTPGGDMGEFLVAMATLEDLLRRPFTEAEVAELFRRRLEAFGRFYMHSDQSCLDKLFAALHADPRLEGKLQTGSSTIEMTEALHAVPAACREAVVEHLVHPDHIGCGHLRLMLLHSDKYRVRRGLVVSALKSFFYSGWDGATECDYVVLTGQHKECGVANVTLSEAVQPFTRIPLIPPSLPAAQGGNQVFVNHEQISAYLRRQLADWFLVQRDVLPLTRAAKAAFHPMMELLAGSHAENTLGALAADLPMYTLNFDQHGACEVVYNGIIPKPKTESECEHKH